ncbi:MAG TPA: PKD domain-containing protein, partial [Candidatus Eisenbacteria bacterium]|nr:PKD domain-containing protein [Candidatus Eisenbacteria bacterium]
GNGDGTLGPATDHPGGFFNGSGVGVPDINGDGDLDVVRVGSNSLALLLGRGDGTFEPPVTMAGPRNGTFLGSGRIDLDGRDDFAVGSHAGGLQESPANVFLGRDGVPAPAPPIHVLGLGYQELNVHDMTGDGVPDVVLQIDGFEGFGSDLPPIAGGFSVLVGDGTGAFVDRTDVRLNETTFRGLTTGDWDRDGRIDVAATLGYSPNIMIFLNRGYRPNADRPVSMYGNSTLRNVQEGVPSSALFIADDPDGDPITFSVDRSALPDGITLETSTPEFPWRLRLGIHADFGTEGEHPFAVLASANGTTASWPVRLFVQRGNRPPLADAGGPYEGVVGVPVTLDGSGSSDPDGNALTYRWNFGDATEGVGAVVNHTYTAVRVFQVTLTVRDGATFNSSDSDITQATIVDALKAEAYLQGSSRTVSLVGSSRPSTCFQIEPSGGNFTPGEIDPATIRMQYTGGGSVSEISA